MKRKLSVTFYEGFQKRQRLIMAAHEFWVGMSFLIFTLLMVGGITVAVFWDVKKGAKSEK